MTNDILLEKVIKYCELSFPKPTQDDPEDVRKQKMNKYNCVYTLTNLFMDFPEVDIRDVLLEMISNIVTYKNSNATKCDYYGISIEDCDDYLKTLVTVSRFIRSLEYKEKNENE